MTLRIFKLALFFVGLVVFSTGTWEAQAQSCTPNVNACTPNPACMTPTAGADGQVGTPYTATFSFVMKPTIDTLNLTFQVVSVRVDGFGSVPPGLAVNIKSGNDRNNGTTGFITIPGTITPRVNNTPLYACGVVSGTPTAAYDGKIKINLTVTYRSSFGLTQTAPATLEFAIKIVDAPGKLTVKAGSDVTIQCGNTTTLKATSSDSTAKFSWSPAAGLSDPNSPNPVANPTKTTAYIVTATNGNQKASDTVIVNVQQADYRLNFTATPSSFLTKPFTVNFVAQQAGPNPNPNMTYTWLFGDGTTGTGTPVSHTYQDTGTYTVTLIGVPRGSECRDTLKSGDRPNLPFIVCKDVPADVFVVDAGTDATIDCGGRYNLRATTNKTGVTYTWLPNLGGNNTQQNYNVSPTATTVFTVTARSGNEVATDMVKVTIRDANYQLAFTADQTTLTQQPYTVTFTNNTAMPGLTFAWDFGDGNTSTQRDPVHTYAADGEYTVTLIARRQAGGPGGNAVCPDTLIKQKYIICKTEAFTVDAGTPATIACGSSVDLKAVASIATGVQYSWQPQASLKNFNTATPTAAPTETTVYTVTATYQGRTTTDTVSVYVTPMAATIAGINNQYCVNATQTDNFTGTPTGGQFTAIPGILTTAGVFSYPTAGTYSIVYSGDQNGCKYSSIRSVTVTSPSASITEIGTEFCVTQTQAINLVGTPTGGIFSGPGVTRVGGAGSGTYRFTPSTAGVGTHAIVYQGFTNGCTYRVTDTVKVNAMPTPTIDGLGATQCAGSSVTLTGTPTGGTFAGPDVAGDVFTPQQAGTASVTYQGTQGGCAYSLTKPVTVVALPTISLSITDATTGNNGSIVATGNGGTAPYTYKTSTGTYGTSNTFSNLAAGDYTVSVKDANGCEASTTGTVLKKDPPKKIWPGDANADGTVDIVDYFIITSAIGKTGIARTDKGDEWRGYDMPASWNTYTNYRGTLMNNMYLDANGDGKIDATDADIAVRYRGKTY